jgi:uncharacterized Zn finger protein (UPF0148 family)
MKICPLCKIDLEKHKDGETSLYCPYCKRMFTPGYLDRRKPYTHVEEFRPK